MSSIKADTNKLEGLISELNTYSLSFKNHTDQFNDLISKTDSCWLGDKANEYRAMVSSFNKEQFEQTYLTLSGFIDKLSNLQSSLESVIESNKGD